MYESWSTVTCTFSFWEFTKWCLIQKRRKLHVVRYHLKPDNTSWVEYDTRHTVNSAMLLVKWVSVFITYFQFFILCSSGVTHTQTTDMNACQKWSELDQGTILNGQRVFYLEKRIGMNLIPAVPLASKSSFSERHYTTFGQYQLSSVCLVVPFGHF